MIPLLADALAARGYDTLTDVQSAVINPELAEADLLVSAQTGSGKTVAFGLAIAPTILDGADTLPTPEAPLALVVAPTRELAFQVKRELIWLYAGVGARLASCVGGMDMRDERRALERGAHIVVGTPGRLRDHIQRGSLELGALRAVVLDEADEMLDLGFREDLEFMLSEAPEDRRTLLFSATVPPMIETLAQSYQRDAVRVTTLAETSQHADITYQAMRVADGDAENALINVLRYHEARSAIVFANTRLAVSRLTARFANRGFSVVSLSGELSQSERSHALQAMRDGRARVCVATDVAARGIDLPNLDLVIHAELPLNSEALLHRSGRTGRAGRKGTSALIVPPRSVKKAERLLKFAKIKAEWTKAPSADEINERDQARMLEDPTWDTPASDSEAAFAETLLARTSPEQIAAAYLRLFRSRHSAPEDLGDPDEAPARKERAPFGPSEWVSLSIGRSDRAEPRWILPLLCKAGGLTKTDIGAIRVRDSETFVQIAEGRVEALMQHLDKDGVLEQGIRVAPSTGPERGAPGPRPRKDGPPRKERPPRKAPPARVEAAPAPEAAEAPKPDFKKPRKPAEPKPHRGKGPRTDDRKPRKPHRDGDKRPPKHDAKPRSDRDAEAKPKRKPGKASAMMDPSKRIGKPRAPRKGKPNVGGDTPLRRRPSKGDKGAR